MGVRARGACLAAAVAWALVLWLILKKCRVRSRAPYVGPNQINLEVPLLEDSPTDITISTPTGDLPPTAINVAGSIGVFGVLNTDGSVKSPTNPAETNSIVSFYVTGLGPRPTR